MVSDCKCVVACLHSLRAGRRQPKGRHRRFESGALVAMPAGVNIVCMKAHQSDRDAEEGRVQLSDLQGKRLAHPAANNSTRPMSFCGMEALGYCLSHSPGLGCRGP
eukprot:898357-Amphidinium_carterae.1